MNTPSTAFPAASSSSALAEAPAEGPTTLRRHLWLAAGVVFIGLGLLGIVVPLLPTVDMLALAAFCFARGNRRWEAWLLSHPQLGPPIHAWRTHRAVPLPAKCLATLSMGLSCGAALAWMPAATGWLPAAVCLPVLAYLWTRPTLRVMPCKA